MAASGQRTLLCVVLEGSYKQHILSFNLEDLMFTCNSNKTVVIDDPYLDNQIFFLFLQGLLLNFKPEVFSALKVCPMEKTEEQPYEESEPSIAAAAAADSTQSNHPCSTQSSDCSRSTTSVSTEELELSALLSRSSSDGEDSLQSTSQSPINVLQLGERPHTPPPERSSGGNEAEAYVTMSSFYQIK